MDQFNPGNNMEQRGGKKRIFIAILAIVVLSAGGYFAMKFFGKEKEQFSGLPGTIVVVSPNGEERLGEGVMFPISWKASSSIERVDIVLKNDGRPGDEKYYAIARELPNTGNYDWTVPRLKETGFNDWDGTGMYRVIVTQSPYSPLGGLSQDQSDNPFMIVEMPEGPPLPR